MNKLLLSLLGASVALNFYLVKVDVVVKDDLDQEYVEPTPVDQISVAQAGIQKEECKEEVKDSCKYDEMFSKVHDRYWNDVNIFLRETLKLNSDDMEELQELRDERIEEIGKYLNGRNKEKSFLSTEGISQLGKINKKYNSKLRKLMGASDFREYEKFREDFNKKLLDKGLEKFYVKF